MFPVASFTLADFTVTEFALGFFNGANLTRGNLWYKFFKKQQGTSEQIINQSQLSITADLF